MTIPLESPFKKRRAWDTFHGLDLFRSIATFLVACLGALKFLSTDDPERYLGWSCVVLAVVILFVDGRKYFIHQENEKQKNNPHALDATIDAIHAAVSAITPSKFADADLRMCVFIPDPSDGEKVIQLTDYAGSIREGKHRILSMRSGVVGLAYRDGAAKFASPPKGILTVDFLVSMGFSREEAQGMSLDRQSWAAVPIGIGPRQVLAILYADAKSVKFWGANDDDSKRKIMIAAAVAVAKHIS